MHIFTLEVNNNDFDNAEFVSAPERIIEFERHLESWLENNPWVLCQGEDILWIHKERTVPGGESSVRPDLIGVDAGGRLVIVELKRSRTPRDTIAQLLDYAASVADPNELSDEKIHEMAEIYFNTRDGLRGKSFHDAFKEVLLTRKTDEVPPLNRSLRLFIVAGKISEKILKICKFLRTSHNMDISCIAVSMFQTESADVIVGMETKLGDGNRRTPIPPQNGDSDTLRWKMVWRAILQLTDGNPNGEFTTGGVKDAVLEVHPDFNENTISGSICSFRQSRHIVLEAIQQLKDGNIGVDFTSENILKVILEEPPDFNQLRIREMIDMFCQFGISHIQPNQTEQVTEN